MIGALTLVLTSACKHGDTDTPTDTSTRETGPWETDASQPQDSGHPETDTDTDTDTHTYTDTFAESGDSGRDSATSVPCDTGSLGDMTDNYSPGPWRKVSCGLYHCCGLREDGYIACWGYEDGSGATADAPCGNDFVDVATGSQVSCAIHADDTLTCWGLSGPHTYLGHSYDFTPPSGTFTNVEATFLYVCATSAVDSSLSCWGYDAYGSDSAPPAGAYAGLAVGGGACALAADGSPTCWGNTFMESPSSGPYSAIGAGIEVGAGIAADGSIEAWTTYSDPCGEADVPADAVTMLDFADNWYGCAIRAADGGIDCWGLEGGASCPWSSLGGTGAADILTNIPPGTFTSLSAGYAGVCAIDVDGGMTCWGNPDRDGGQFNPPD